MKYSHFHCKPLIFLSITVGAERRGSIASNAPSELSRSDVATRGKSKADTNNIREKAKNYYKVVYENKEVNKLLQMLGTAISATKAVRISDYPWFYPAPPMLTSFLLITDFLPIHYSVSLLIFHPFLCQLHQFPFSSCTTNLFDSWDKQIQFVTHDGLSLSNGVYSQIITIGAISIWQYFDRRTVR